MTDARAIDIPQVTEFWGARPRLTVSQWASLYGALHQLCRPSKEESAGAVWNEAFDRFFLGRVVEATPSELPSLNCVRLYFDWYRSLFDARDDLSAGFKALEDRDSCARVPGLTELEDALCRPSDALCVDMARRLVAGDLQVDELDDEELAARVQQVADAMRRRALTFGSTVVEMPGHVAAYVARRVAAETHGFSTMPQRGQILRIDALTGPAGPLKDDLARPLLVLVDGPTDVDSVWWGWMLGAEPDYACEWDFVLGPGDEPRDPMAAVVQLWNPVHVYLPTVERVVGQLTEERMAELHALVADFLAGADAPAAEAVSQVTSSPMRVQRKTEAGLVVLTGQPLGDETDVRRVYQTLYESVADLVQQPARLAAAALADAAWLERAAVRQVGVNRFEATAAHDPSLKLEVTFQFPGAGEAVMLIQTRDGKRDRAPLNVRGQRIDMEGGVAFPAADLAAEVATALRLPDAFVRWAEVGAEFERTRRRTTGRTRDALQGLLRAVSEAALSPAHLYRFLFEPNGVPAVRSAGERTEAGSGPGPAPVVVRLDRTGPRRGKVHLWWLAPPPAIERVELMTGGKAAEQASVAGWEPGLASVDVAGLALDEGASAHAQVHGRTLRIDIG